MLPACGEGEASKAGRARQASDGKPTTSQRRQADDSQAALAAKPGQGRTRLR
ncbi:hypothetical protein ACS0Y7_04575 [Burkholderia gladioli]|uniref:hypothetical protein n=1 Tax=Burkholderia gladioli TaxID=28095 RepID=UPI003F7A309C